MIDSGKVDHFQDLPARLEALLRRKGVSQRELHRRSGVSTSRINEYVKGKGGPPTLPILNRILDALGARRGELFSDPISAREGHAGPPTFESRLARLEEQYSYVEAEFGRLKLAFENSLGTSTKNTTTDDDSRNRKPAN